MEFIEDVDVDDLYGEIDIPFNYVLDDNNNNYNDNFSSPLINDFKTIDSFKISTKNNSLYEEIQKETSEIFSYFIKKTKDFPKIFEKESVSLEETYNYLKSIAIQNKCECAGIIENIPGWRCEECSKYENSIYCSNCYLNSKHLHKGHKIEFLYSSGGMCDCGDPDSLNIFCMDHCGPYTEQKQIDEFINKSFSPEILKNLKIFFDEFFMRFSEYFLLTEKCKYFYSEILEENIKNLNEKDDINLLKNNFAIVFENFITFLFKITENNLGMMHLIFSYFLKNNLPDEKVETTHSCIKIQNDNIEILYKDKNYLENLFSSFNFSGQIKHKCECPFLRLLFSNWRDNIKPFNKSDSQNEKFLLSFSHNLFLRQTSCIMVFFLYKEIFLNNNEEDIIYTRNQFYIEDSIEFIAKKTNLIEESYEFLYFYMKKVLDSPKSKDFFGGYKPKVIEKLLDRIRIYMGDCKYFTKPKIIQLMYNKTCLFKRIIDVSCLMHNIMDFKSIFPHPHFNEKKCVVELINTELYFIYIGNVLCLFTNWGNIDIVKELFNYFVEKIIYLNKSKNLKKDVFSFHLLIYRIFSSFLNFFCFNYALKNKTDINSGIIFTKNNLFKSKEEMQKIINIILNDYYKMYGFIIGIRNEYFNYYDLNNYNFIYFNDLRQLKHDYTLLKYLFAMTEESINIEEILKTSNIENVYNLFDKVFISNNYRPQTKNEQTEENTKKEEKKGFSFFGILNGIKNMFDVKSYFSKGLTKDEEENKHVMQWKRILEVIITIMKNDTTALWDILVYYDEAISLKTKNNLFNTIKENKNIMDDIKNMLKERLVQIIIANGNLMDLKGIKDGIDKFYFKLLKEEEFNEILDELTISKMNGEKKEFYLKDSSLKYLDMNYYYSPMTKSKAEIYISDFKKDTFKTFNSYYYKPSPFTFDFYHKVYENILLNVDNINLFVKIIDILLQPLKEDDLKFYDLNSIRKMFLPIILNFISMLFSINSKLFIKFKIKNENLINNIYEILNNAIKYNKSIENKLFDNEIEENIIELINKYNNFNIIKEYSNDIINKLNDKDYYTDNNFKLEENEENNNKNKINIFEKISTEGDKKKNKAKNMKEHLKDMMKKKSEKFMKKASKNKDMKQIIESKISKDNNNETEEEDETMCFFCRNPIYLKKFDKPYGKLCLIFDDLFYVNSFKSTLNSEINYLTEKNDKNIKNIINSVITNKKIIDLKQPRITSCGHYFHQSCFYKGYTFDKNFKCPLCEKVQNILIPPLINYTKNDNFKKYLKSLKFDEIFENDSFSEKETEDSMHYAFKNIVFTFIEEITILHRFFRKNVIKLLDILPTYQSCMNFLINLFYSNGTTFHKQQQIEINQNILLSIRYLLNINNMNITYEIKNIRNIINNLIEIPNVGEKIMNDFMNMTYSNNFDLILFIFSILLDYDELQNSFIYIINWILPYISFWLYLRNKIQKNNFYTLSDQTLKEEINLDNLKQFLNDNNTILNNYLKLFLHKLLIIKIYANYNNTKKTELNLNIKEFSITQIFTLLNMDKISNSLNKNNNNEIIFTDLFEKIPKTFENKNNLIIYDYNEIFNKMIINIKKNILTKTLVNAEFLAQFITFEFKLITLDENIFDWIEKCLYKKCCICLKESKYYYICLICGEKICYTKSCDRINVHLDKCGGGSGIVIYIGNAKITFIKSSTNNKKRNEAYPLYVNNSGVGPNGYQMGNEYYLSKEKYSLALKDYVSNDFH